MSDLNALTAVPTFEIDLNNLRPLEQFVLDAETGSYTASRLAEAAAETGIVLADHPCYELVKYYKNFVCLHKTHDTEDKKQKCIDMQIGKEIVECIRAHLANLQYRKMVRDEWNKHYVYWLCTDSEICRERIGTVESTSELRVTVAHPDCRCNMRYCQPDKADDTELYGTWDDLNESNPELAVVFENNVTRSGWHIAPPFDEDDDIDFDEEDYVDDDIYSSTDDVLDPEKYCLVFWDDNARELHNEPEQRSRQARARTVTVERILNDKGARGGSINGYVVMLKYCECADFQERKLPCKHIYRLAHEFGVFNLDTGDYPPASAKVGAGKVAGSGCGGVLGAIMVILVAAYLLSTILS